MIVISTTSIADKSEMPQLVGESISLHYGVQQACHLICERFQEPWTLASLAHEVGMSRSALASLFAAATGIPPMRYLFECRMRHAARLLADAEVLIKQIPRRVGYRSTSTFTTAFKRWAGVSASEYRSVHAAS